ncbi:hypothetical protein KAU88_09310 [Candidatus Bathyarchaeota archaeon]|nr:hypothetical protein [Candidatus Bathyarchaeota archaeon]
MRSKTLISILTVALVVSVLGFFIFAFEGGLGGRGHGMAPEVPQSFWLVMFAVPLVIAVSVLGYSLIFPELNIEKTKEKTSRRTVEKGEPVLDAILRVLNEDEKKIIETLVAEGGTMLQKDIRWKTGLSRVKTHRILFRLAGRGIVSVEKYYNTNKIVLASWLMKEKKES